MIPNSYALVSKFKAQRIPSEASEPNKTKLHGYTKTDGLDSWASTTEVDDNVERQPREWTPAGSLNPVQTQTRAAPSKRALAGKSRASRLKRR